MVVCLVCGGMVSHVIGIGIVVLIIIGVVRCRQWWFRTPNPNPNPNLDSPGVWSEDPGTPPEN